MPDLISREAALLVVDGMTDVDGCYHAIEKLPAVDPETIRPTAKWLNWKGGNGQAPIFCAHCFTSDRVHRDMKFCPNCGAAMQQEEK